MLLKQIRIDFDNARREKNEIKKQALEALLADVINKEKSGSNIVLTDADIIQCIEKQIKILSEQMELYANKYMDKYELYSKQKIYLKHYLPKQLTEEEVKTEINIIYSLIIPEDKNKAKGLIMRELMSIIAGKFDKSKVNNLVDEVLNRQR